MASFGGDTRLAAGFGIGFVVLFTVGLTALLGDLVGGFADAASSFNSYFDDASERRRQALGGYFLAGSGIAFLGFVVSAARADDDNRTVAQAACLSAAVFAAVVGVSAGAFATVAVSIGFGEITGDPGIQEGWDILPSLGYVLLAVPAALSGAVAISLLALDTARASRLPGWITAAAYPVALAQLLSIFTLPLALLPLWVLAASLSLARRRPHPWPADGGRAK